jgi:hypothetical protein
LPTHCYQKAAPPIGGAANDHCARTPAIERLENTTLLFVSLTNRRCAGSQGRGCGRDPGSWVLNSTMICIEFVSFARCEVERRATLEPKGLFAAQCCLRKNQTMMRTFLACVLFAAVSSGLLAQPLQKLPSSPAYRGEIRRGAEGGLTFLEPVDALDTSREGVSRPVTMRVGSRERITSISEAARLARDGEVIEIASGEYRGQPAVWTQNDLIIRGAGARAVMVADGKSAEGKAIWVIRGGRVRIENIEFRGARVAAGNGAGIRFERGQLVVHRCAFIDNEMGVLTANFPEMTLEVSDSEFSMAPRHSGQLHHLLYVGAIGRFVLSGSRFAQGYLGHLVKSRASENYVHYNMLVDGAQGRSSYELEFPNGGMAYVVGNVIGQSLVTDNPALVSYGAEGQRWPRNGLFLAHNTLVNDLPEGVLLRIWAPKFPGGVETWLINNLTVGYGELFAPANGRFEGNQSARPDQLLDYGGVPLRLAVTSGLRGSVRIPGSASGVDLYPAREFDFPAGSRAIEPAHSLTPGAFQ